ncbi:MAG TPA: hypothetical protein V6D20_01095 [Candidatus Obscuribacterales bacterium]
MKRGRKGLDDVALSMTPPRSPPISPQLSLQSARSGKTDIFSSKLLG